jgi:lipid II isoglutaminyl synthase (glutamine-hydrolysing)
MNVLLIYFGKLVSFFVKLFNLGNGSTWPGHIALRVNPKFIRQTIRDSRIKVIFVIGTNGKTTTSSLIKTILEKDRKRVIHNASGANLLNGVASTLLLSSNLFGRINKDFAIFEIDENAFPHVAKEITPDYVVAINLFRDQLDRYGEVNTIGKKWKETIERLPKSTVLILNADDPEIAYLGERSEQIAYYFGLSEKSTKKEADHAADSLYCPVCGAKLTYTKVYFSHLGSWYCKKCDFKHPLMSLTASSVYPLDGVYNKYNVHAAMLLGTVLGIEKQTITSALENFTPAFGRGETIEYKKTKIRLFLSKNPTGMNESLRTVNELGGKHLLFLLNDRTPDGTDVSWIWDVDFEDLLPSNSHIHVSGDRAYDMSLRIKYAHPAVNHVDTYEIVDKALDDIVKTVPADETLYVLPTYSAMLDLRKIIGGKKIL